MWQPHHACCLSSSLFSQLPYSVSEHKETQWLGGVTDTLLGFLLPVAVVECGLESLWTLELQVSQSYSVLWLFIFFLFMTTPAACEVLRIGVESELQLTGLHHSSWQCWILDPLCEARDSTHILMDTSWVLNPPRCNGNSGCMVTAVMFPEPSRNNVKNH